MKDNKIVNMDSNTKTPYQQDLCEIKNELIDKLTKMFNEFVRSSIKKKDQTNNYHTITHIIYLICSNNNYFDNDLLYDLDFCVDDLLAVYTSCIDRSKSYKKLYEKYKQTMYYQKVQNRANNSDN